MVDGKVAASQRRASHFSRRSFNRATRAEATRHAPLATCHVRRRRRRAQADTSGVLCATGCFARHNALATQCFARQKNRIHMSAHTSVSRTRIRTPTAQSTMRRLRAVCARAALHIFHSRNVLECSQSSQPPLWTNLWTIGGCAEFPNHLYGPPCGTLVAVENGGCAIFIPAATRQAPSRV